MNSPTPNDIAIAQTLQALRIFLEGELTKARKEENAERILEVSGAVLGYNFLLDQCFSLMHLIAHADPADMAKAYDAMAACNEKAQNASATVH